MKAGQFSADEVQFLKEFYPIKGKAWCMRQLDRSERSIRTKASELELRQDRSSDFFKEWQRRAAATKVGKKRPAQALVMKQLHADGKMAQTPEQRAVNGRKRAEHIRIHGHPRGMLGKTHSASLRRATSKRFRRLHADPNSKFNSPHYRQVLSDRMSAAMRLRLQTKGTVYSRSKNGWYEIGGARYYFRSFWEVNYARHLEYLLRQGKIRQWEHEPETFWFDKIKRGVRSYLPDFRVTELSGNVAYHEVKGWMDPRSVTKIARMAKYYPDVRLIVIGKNEYKSVLMYERLYPEARLIPSDTRSPASRTTTIARYGR